MEKPPEGGYKEFMIDILKIATGVSIAAFFIIMFCCGMWRLRHTKPNGENMDWTGFICVLFPLGWVVLAMLSFIGP